MTENGSPFKDKEEVKWTTDQLLSLELQKRQQDYDLDILRLEQAHEKRYDQGNAEAHKSHNRYSMALTVLGAIAIVAIIIIVPLLNKPPGKVEIIEGKMNMPSHVMLVCTDNECVACTAKSCGFIDSWQPTDE